LKKQPLRLLPPLTSSNLAVIIPVRITRQQQVGVLQKSIDALAIQTLQPALVVLVDDGSTVPYELNAPFPLVRLEQEWHGGPAAARNRGLAFARERNADVILFTDSDCQPEPTWCRAYVDFFHRDPSAGAAGGTTRASGRTLFDRFHDHDGTLNGRRAPWNELLFGPTCNFAIRKEVAEIIRFDESFRHAAAEDIDFSFQIRQGGFSIRRCAEAIVRHDFGYTPFRPATNLYTMIERFRRYAVGQRRLLEKYPDYPRYHLASEPLPVLEPIAE
jgi:glycosyltransferase involved in cell wall biosynthesis